MTLQQLVATSDEVAMVSCAVSLVGFSVAFGLWRKAAATLRWSRAMNGSTFLIARMRCRATGVIAMVQAWFVLSAGQSALTLPDSGPRIEGPLALTLWAKLALQLALSVWLVRVQLANQKDNARLEGSLS